jgi:DNA polymerase (family 10)
MYKEMTNVEIAELLRSVAAAYEIKNKDINKFRIIAYERAADSIEHLSSEAKDLWDDGKLDEVAGIGESITKNLGELFKRGRSRHFDSILKDIPSSVFELLPIEGVGPITAFKLVKVLRISSPDAVGKLKIMAEKGKVAEIPGFGEDSQRAILASIKEIKGREKRYLINYAEEISLELMDWLKGNQKVIRCDSLGSLRRKASTIGDIDISVSTMDPKNVIQHFTKYPKANRILEKGDKTASIILPGNIQVDLMVQQPESYGSLLQHFTGSKNHNIALREFSLQRNLSLSEYGIRELKAKNKKLNIFKTEEEFYNFLGLDYIPPEMREGNGEIESALDHKLPMLIKLDEVKSDLQIHSDFDIETSHDLGESTDEEIIGKADLLGYEYLAFTEHNPSLRGHNENTILDLLKRKKEHVDKLNYFLSNSNVHRLKKVFNSLEIDILTDGRLPVPEKGLEYLDFALISIHSNFRQNRKEVTDRVIKGLSNPKVKIFAHPTGRKLNEREGVDLDWEVIFDYCQKNLIWLEINADPMRLDLPDHLVKEAVKRGIKLTLGTDSHNIMQMDNIKYGVYVARRGWAEKSDIINTYNLEEFLNIIKMDGGDK